MREVSLETPAGSTRIVIGESLGNLGRYAERGRTVLLVDPNVARIHGHLLAGYERVDVGCGEAAKSLGNIERICRCLLELGVDRSWLVVGIGGGVACDIAGFAASVFMRGLACGFAPTSLLAQADASIGGTNGVNLDGYKNIVGLFNPPRFVISDLEVLRSLPGREVVGGAAEIITPALIGDRVMFDYLEQHWRRLLALERDAVEEVVGRSAALKSRIVRLDEREAGERRKLNFGHTLAHALEKTAGVSHGEAVGMGMAFAARVSAARGLLSSADALRISELLRQVGLPAEMPAATGPLLEALGKDKKREGGFLHFVLLEGIGQADVCKLSRVELEGYLHDLR